jgi:hypothetical protein
MRITLLCTESLRTPACPGFGVSGDRKLSSFDRFGRQREVGRELGLWGERAGAFERVQMRAVTGDRGGRGAFFGGLIERVQMGIRGASSRGTARVGGSFERVQMGRESGLRLRLAGAAGAVGALKRAEVAWGLGRPTARRDSSGSSFERVQTRFDSPVGDVGGRTVGPFEHVQIGDGLGMPGAETRAPAGLFERVQMEDGPGMPGAETRASAGLLERVQMRVRFIARRAAMPRLK